MPALSHLALRYAAWLIGLRLVFGLLVQVAGLPNLPAAGVILAAVPALDIGSQAVKRATRPLAFGDWVTIWSLCLAIFAAIQVILPLLLFTQMRMSIMVPGVVQSMTLILVSTGLMLGLFLWIGQRMAR